MKFENKKELIEAIENVVEAAEVCAMRIFARRTKNLLVDAFLKKSTVLRK